MFETEISTFVIATIYTFGDYARWSWPWTSPTCLGTCIVLVLPIVWGLQIFTYRAWSTRLAMLSEIGLYVILCKTYSRGSLVAVAATGFFTLLCHFRDKALDRSWNVRTLAWVLGWRIVAFGIILFATGFFARLAPSYLATDKSVQHRGSLWLGGLRMIQESPWQGWGRHEGPLHYMHWYQPLGEETEYGNMVNGNLTLAVERGLPAFVAISALVIWCLLAPFAISRYLRPLGALFPHSICLGLAKIFAASAFGYVVGNTFSTLTEQSDFLNLWVMACLVGCGVMYFIGARCIIGKFIFLATGGAIVLTTILLTLSVIIARSLPVVVERRDGNQFILRKPETQSYAPMIRIYPDPDVLGRYFGRAIRQWVITAKPGLRMIVDTSSSPQPPLAGERIFLFGRAASFFGEQLPERTVLVHPVVVSPPLLLPKAKTVVLPAFDQLGDQSAWMDWAAQTGHSLLRSPGVGQDLRPSWPLINQQLLYEP